MQKLRLGVLGSGKGSNFRAICEAIQAGLLDARVVIVCSDVVDSGILRLARDAGLATGWIDEGRFKTRLSTEREEALVEQLRASGVELVVLAGYMRMLKTPMLEAFPRHIINIHPSLLPKFRGLEAWRQALEAGETVTGCTVHFVDEGMDSGETIAQAEVPILPGDTPGSLHARIQQAEHRLYPEVVGRFARGELP
ncbi:MAG: phosphoribosylglycinamide formyltransferase [Terrimicrobiaceae bacterium]